MRPQDLAELLALAAIWGASFLFTRMGAADFGPAALAFVRVAVAALFLLPVLMWRRQGPALRTHWKPIAIVGLLNSALPFAAFAFAALSITAGLSSIFNATTPLWAALIAWLWLRDRLTPLRVVGLAIGFAGVLWLAWDKASFKPGGTGWAVVACLAATLCYGLAASFAKRHLQGVPPLATATGSQTSAAIALAVPALLWWPTTAPPAAAWWTALALGVVCTGVAYILYFRLIANVGPANAISVTFLIPMFGVLWGWLFLDESLTWVMLAACGVILAGTALVTGLLQWPARTGEKTDSRLGGRLSE
jgi:drug/metabolite transporter (DMT)-like permease